MNLGLGRFEGLSDLEVRQFLRACPLLVWVDLQIIAIQYRQTRCLESLTAIQYLNLIPGPFCVFATACQKATNDEFMDPSVFIVKSCRINKVDWMNRRMGFIIVASIAWLTKIAIEKT